MSFLPVTRHVLPCGNSACTVLLPYFTGTIKYNDTNKALEVAGAFFFTSECLAGRYLWNMFVLHIQR